jgi:tetratricopeptide (TPR) repeat protein
MGSFLKRIWQDPVWSKVISALILAATSYVWYLLSWETFAKAFPFGVCGIVWLGLLFLYARIRHGSRKWFGVSILFLLITSPVLFYVTLTYIANRPADKIIILVADFDGPDPTNDRVTQNLYERMANAIRDYPDLKVQLLGEPISFKEGSNAARLKGHEKKATLVRWGSYGKTDDAVQITVNYEVLDPPCSLQPLASGSPCTAQDIHKTLTYPVQDLNTFVLQANLARQVSALTQLSVGITLYRAGKFDASIAHFNKALTEWRSTGDPIVEPADIYFWRADAQMAGGSFDAAIADFGMVIQLEPGNASAYNNRGRAYDEKGDEEKAFADYSQAITLASTICLPCALTNRGRLFFNKGDYDNAVADYTRAIQISPDNADAYDGRGRAYTHKRDFQKAIADHNQAVRLSPNTPDFYDNRGHAYEESRDYDSAIADYTRALRLDGKRPLFFTNRGRAYTEKRYFYYALADLGTAIKIDPSYAEAYHVRGHVYVETGDSDKALNDFNRAIGVYGGESPELFWDRAWMYHSKNDFDAALGDRSKIIQLAPTDSEAYRLRGNVYVDKEEFDKALADFDTSIGFTPNNPLTYDDRGQIFARKNDYHNAITDYTEAITLDPNFTRAYSHRAHAYLDTGEKEKAMIDFDKAITANPGIPGYHADRAELHASEGNYGKALKDYQMAFDLTPDSKMREILFKKLSTTRSKLSK